MTKTPASARPRRRRKLDRQQLVAAAIGLMQREGYDRLTIRNLAAELGVKSASLYWHIEDKEELDDLVADALLDGCRPPARTLDWRADVRNAALSIYRHLTHKRDAGRVLAGRFVVGPNALGWMEAGLEPFRRGGLTAKAAAFASHAVHVYVVGFIAFQGSPLSAQDARSARRAEVLAERRRLFESLPAARYPTLSGMAHELTVAEGEARFLFGLDALIAGIAGATAHAGS